MYNIVNTKNVYPDTLKVLDNILYNGLVGEIKEKGTKVGDISQPETRKNEYINFFKAVFIDGSVYYREFPTTNTFGSVVLEVNLKNIIPEKLII